MNTRSLRFRMTAWYAGLLSGLLILFGVFIYFTLAHFLASGLRDTLSRESQTIGEALLRNVDETGEAYVRQEMEEHFAPRITSRFLRVTRGDGSIFYQSEPPENGSVDPSKIPTIPFDELHPWHEESLSDGRHLLIYSMSFPGQKESRFLIQAGAPNDQVQDVLHELLLSFAVAFPLIVGIAVFGGYLLMRNALRPLEEFATAAERITSRSLNERLPKGSSGDELGKLAVSLNRMMARLEESFQHINRFSADASHEIRTPLAIIQGELESASQSVTLTPELRETIGSALEESERLSKIVEQLLEISRLEAGEKLEDRSQFDFAEMARMTVEQMRLLADEKNIQLSFTGTPPVTVAADRMRMKQVVVNLVDNAIKYTPSGGSVSVSSFTVDGKAILEVADTGIGVPREAAPHVFDRFYRVDKARARQLGGTGLGLAIVKSICLVYGGTVALRYPGGPGAVFRVELPIESRE